MSYFLPRLRRKKKSDKPISGYCGFPNLSNPESKCRNPVKVQGELCYRHKEKADEHS